FEEGRRGAVRVRDLALQPGQHALAEPFALALPERGVARRTAGHDGGERAVRLREQARAQLRGVAQGQLAALAQAAQEALGHPVERVAALERLEPLAFLRLQRRLQREHVLEQVAEAALPPG